MRNFLFWIEKEIACPLQPCCFVSLQPKICQKIDAMAALQRISSKNGRRVYTKPNLSYVLIQVSVPKKVSGWRDKLSRSDSLKKEEPASPAYHGKKRSSITKARPTYTLCFLGLTLILNIKHQGESFSGIPVFHNQATGTQVSITKKFFRLNENCVLTCGNIKVQILGKTDFMK